MYKTGHLYAQAFTSEDDVISILHKEKDGD